MTAPSPLDRVIQLARIAEALERGEAPAVADGQWIAAALRGYLADAALGVSMEDAMGITAQTGQCAWWRVEARNKRNAALVELHRHLFADMEIPKAANELARLFHRVRNPTRKAAHGPATDASPLDARTETLINAAMYSGAPFPAPKQIANILEIKTPI